MASIFVSRGQHPKADFTKSKYNRKLNNRNKHSDTSDSWCI